ncbi:MAG: hypothetical protein WA980_11375 [Shinella zoogloeoides]
MKLFNPSSYWFKKRSTQAENDALSDGFKQTPVAKFDLFSLAVRSMR